MSRKLVPPVVATGYVGTTLAANAAVEHIGIVPVGFGLVAPAGVFFAGLGFILRDALHETAPRPSAWVLGAIGVGMAVSLVAGTGRIALAGALAFLISELLDFAVYSPLRKRGKVPAMIASNIAGLLADSAVFLSVAFGSLEFFAGQAVGKLWVTAVVVSTYMGVRRAVLSRHA